MGWDVGEVVELVWIVPMAVQFLGSVFVNNQSPVAAADGVIAEVRRCDRRPFPGCCWIAQLSDQGCSFEVPVLRQFAQLDQRRVDVDQPGRFVAPCWDRASFSWLGRTWIQA